MERYDLNTIPNASSETAGVLRVANSADEKNCGCKDAAITPSNLYSLLDCRKANTAYAAGVIVTCPYHKEFLLKCSTGGTTSANSLNTTAVTKGSVITDGGVKWTVIASQIIDLAISGKTITVTFIDGTSKKLTTQDTNTTYTAGTGLSLSSNKFSLAAAYSNPITGATISGKVITLTFADGTTKTLTTQDTNTVPARYITTKYASGKNWYEVYSDGWVRQGGFVTITANPTTVTLHKKMGNTNYKILFGQYLDTTASWDNNVRIYNPPTVSNFQVAGNANLHANGCYWEAEGYGA